MLDGFSVGQFGATSAPPECEMRDAPLVLHEGHSIVIDMPVGAKRDTLMLPLRNGFPINVTDRQAPVFALYNNFHEVAGLAIKIPGFGLSIHFHEPVPGGRFYFQISGPSGAA